MSFIPANPNAATTMSAMVATQLLSWKRPGWARLERISMFRPRLTPAVPPRRARAATADGIRPERCRGPAIRLRQLQSSAHARLHGHCSGALNPGCPTPTAHCRLPAADCLPPTAYRRLPSVLSGQQAPRGIGEPCGQVCGWWRNVQIFSVTSGLSECSILQAWSSSASLSIPKVS